MTGSGQTLPSRDFCGTAALPLKPDIGWRGWRVRKPAHERTHAAQQNGISLFGQTLKRDHHYELSPIDIPTMADGSPQLF
jgi:hypothetical protein